VVAIDYAAIFTFIETRTKEAVTMETKTSPHEDDIDSCDINFAEEKATPDTELPATTGGIQVVSKQTGSEDEIDACDLDFAEAKATTDAELPATTGGVGR
jgi:hypothetical protein